MSKFNTSNLSALAEVIRCLAMCGDKAITGELCRYLDAPTKLKFNVLCEKLKPYVDDLALEEFREWGCSW